MDKASNDHRGRLPVLSATPDTPARVQRIALTGNVCVGKTSLFGALCKNGVQSVNVPGSTLDVLSGVLAIGPGGASRSLRRRCSGCSAKARHKRQLCCAVASGCPSSTKACPVLFNGSGEPTPTITFLLDTPGSATLAANSEDEMVTRDLVLSGQLDGVVVVADAKNIRRSLAFVLEMAEFGVPMLIDLNMLDEAEIMGIEIDDGALVREMGVPVARTVAVENRGVRRLAELLLQGSVSPRRASFSELVESALEGFGEILENPVLPPRALGMLLLCEDRGAQRWVAEHLGGQALEKARAIVSKTQSASPTPLKGYFSDAFFGEAERIANRVLTSTTRNPSLLVRFGQLAQQPVAGTLIALGVLVLAYFWVGAFGATFVVDTLATHVLDGFLVPLASRAVAVIPSAFVRDAITDPDFGLLPTGLFLAVGIVLPILFCFYLLQAVLEESGYLPRLAVLFDRLFRWMGLNGQCMIPLVLGFSCITMAVITTRMLPTRKERIILTLLLILGIPCAPLLAVMFVILGKMPVTASLTLFGVIVSQILLVGWLASKVLPGDLPDLILEIPQMRVPRVGIVLSKTWRHTGQFMREALPIFLVASFVVFVFDRIGGLAVMEDLFHPFIKTVLGLPDEFVQVLIKTAIRRETGAVELDHVRDSFSNLQLVVSMLVMTFLMPCINAMIVIVKERGLKIALVILGSVAVWAIVVGALVNLFCRGLGITF